MIGLVDAVIALGLVGVAVWALGTDDLIMAIAFFVVFGLLMTLAWARLDAPDIALAEAGIGTGLTGALFLAVLSRMRRVGEEPKSDRNAESE